MNERIKFEKAPSDLEIIEKVNKFLQEKFITKCYFDSFEVDMDSNGDKLNIHLEYIRGKTFCKDVILSLTELKFIRSEHLEKLLEVNIM